MSQADELLNSLTEDSTEVLLDGNVLVDEKRVVRVPESLKKLGVQYDHDVNTVTFDCPRYSDGHDLSKMRVYVNYMRPDGEVGAHLCDNITIDIYDTNFFHFDWTISGHVTEVNGPLSFLVCIKQVDDEGNEVNHWNSELNTEMYISEGMKCADPIVRRHPDIITQMLLRMDEIEHLLELTENERILAEISEIREDVDNLGQPDATLTKAGVAADAKATSDAIANAQTAAEDTAKKYTDEQIEIVYENFPPAIVVDSEEPEDIEFWIDEDDEVESGTVVTSYNGRTGAVMPQAGDVVPQAGDYDEFYYTKAETLTPETKTLLGLGADDTPDKAFKKAAADMSRVGDVVTTTRVDLGDNWLLANGDEVSAHDYSELELLFPAIDADWSFKARDTSTSKTCTGANYVIHADGYWLTGWGKYDGSDLTVKIAYTTDPTGEWTTKTIFTGSAALYVDCITYANGYWVIGCRYATSIVAILYATDLSGEWTMKTVYSSSGGFDDRICLTYANGYWAIGGAFYNGSGTYYSEIAYTTDLTGTWTVKHMWTGTNAKTRISGIAFANGYWVVCGIQYTSSKYYALIACAADLSGVWTTKELWNGSTVYETVECITYTNGYWVVGCGTYINKSGVAQIAYATNPVSDWVIKDIWGATNAAWEAIYDITYSNGYWMACGRYSDGTGMYYAQIAYAPDLTGDWVTKSVSSGSSDSDLHATNVICVDGLWVGSIQMDEGGTCYPAVFWRNWNTFFLPTITHDNAYTYIKAKED